LNNADSNGGTLTLSDGQHTTDLHFVGSYELANFKLSCDGYGGTLLIDPPVSAQQSESGAAYTDITGHSLPGFAREDSNPGNDRIDLSAIDANVAVGGDQHLASVAHSTSVPENNTNWHLLP